jgi:hypothetical protein
MREGVLLHVDTQTLALRLGVQETRQDLGHRGWDCSLI